MSVNGLHRDRDRVSGRVRVSVRVRDRVRACRLDSSGNLLTWHKMEFAQLSLLVVLIKFALLYSYQFLHCLICR